MELRNQRILVTGGAGFIGSHLVDALLAAGNTVTVLDDFSTGHRHNLEDALKTGRLTILDGNILDDDTLKRALKLADDDVEVVFHLAVQCLRVCFDQPEYVHDVNATGTLRVLEAVRTHAPNLARFVYVSSSEVYGTAIEAPMTEQHPLRPTTVYGASKLAGESYALAHFKTHGLPVVIARPFNTYGEREHYEGTSGEVIPRFLVRMLNNLPPTLFGDGTQTRDFTNVANTVKGLIRVAETDALLGEAVNIAYGEEVSIAAIADHLRTILKRPDLANEFAERRPGDVDRHYADISRLTQATGFRPTIGIVEGLERYVARFIADHPSPSALLADCQHTNFQVDSDPVGGAVPEAFQHVPAAHA